MSQLLDKLLGRNYLPAWELHTSPRIIVAFEQDFLRRQAAFRAALPPGEPVTMLLQLGWSLELPGMGEQLRQDLQDAQGRFPEVRFVVLTNTAREAQLLTPQVETLWCSHNALLDENRYALAVSSKRRFRAVYVARITPFKRHYLATQVAQLHLIGNYSQAEASYARETLKRFPHAHWSRKIPACWMGHALGQAQCGLALSAAEGAMFSCAEYALCGLPVVNTANVGGRDELIPEFAHFRAEATPESVAAGVAHWQEHPVPPEEIRAEFLRLAAPHRARLQEFLTELTGKSLKLPHKLNVRIRLNPWQKLQHGLKS